MGNAYVGICLPSTCEAKDFEIAVNNWLNDTLGDMFAPIGSKIVDVIDDYHYTSHPRSFTTGDIVTMYIDQSPWDILTEICLTICLFDSSI